MGEITVGGKPYEAQYIIAMARKGCGWFGAIAAFSVVNSLIVLFNGKISFVIGLGATQIIDGVLLAARERAGGSIGIAASVVGFAVSLVVIGVYALIWWLSRRGNAAAYLIGMVLYLLDTLIFVLAQDWMGMAFHVFFLAMLWKGYAYMKQWDRARYLLSQGAVPEPPQPDFS